MELVLSLHAALLTWLYWASASYQLPPSQICTTVLYETSNNDGYNTQMLETAPFPAIE